MKNRNRKIKECTYYIDGMHCSSCEVLIEKKLLKQKNIEFADAFLGEGKVAVRYKGEKPSTKAINKLFKKSGYTFSDEDLRRNNLPLFSISKGMLSINRKKFKKALIILSITLLIILGLYLLQQTNLADKLVLNSSSTYPAFFLFGIIAGISSCAALIGGLLLSMSKQWGEMYKNSNSFLDRMKPFSMFNIGRIISFALLGGILGSLGSALGISLNKTPVITAIVILLVSLVMLILGLQMLEVKWAYKIKITLPKFITRTVANEEKFKGKYMPFLIGALTFFLPCGFTIIAQGLALSSGSFLKGSLMMTFFALGTLPVLAIISLTSVNLTQKPKLNEFFSNIAGILVIIFAIYNLNSQLNLLGLKSLNDINFTRTTTQQVNVPKDTNGNQIVRMIAQGSSYNFSGGSIIEAGIPTKLIVENMGVTGCAVTLSVSGLLKSYVYLQEGTNIIDLGTPPKGAYKITCSMGMVTPIILRAI